MLDFLSSAPESAGSRTPLSLSSRLLFPHRWPIAPPCLPLVCLSQTSVCFLPFLVVHPALSLPALSLPALFLAALSSLPVIHASFLSPHVLAPKCERGTSNCCRLPSCALVRAHVCCHAHVVYQSAIASVFQCELDTSRGSTLRIISLLFLALAELD